MRTGPQFKTVKRLMEKAVKIRFRLPLNCTVLWSGPVNRKKAEAFCHGHPDSGFQTLGMYLDANYHAFSWKLAALPVQASEKIWCYLSARLAESASGVVGVFAEGIAAPEDREEVAPDHRTSKGNKPNGRNAASGSIYERYDGPALETNPNVGRIFLMGQQTSVRPSQRWDSGAAR